LSFNEEYERRLESYLAKNAEKRKLLKEKKGKVGELHTYKPEDYGLTSEEIRIKFKDYIDKFNLAK